jgi:hypothetical protein
MSPISVPGATVMCSAPTTRTKRLLPVAISFIPMWSAAEPVAQAFSTRVARLKRKAGSAERAKEAVKPCFSKPPKLPT